MTDQMTEPTTEQPVVLEDNEEDQERMRELDERISAQGGIEPTTPDDGTRGAFGSPQTMIAEARKHLAYRETGENDTKFNRWLGPIGGYPHDGFGYPWCHAFVSYCLWHSDNADAGPRTAGCVAGARWFKQRGRFSSEPHVGDLVYYGPNGGTHVELVVGVSADTSRPSAATPRDRSTARRSSTATASTRRPSSAARGSTATATRGTAPTPLPPAAVDPGAAAPAAPARSRSRRR